MGSFRNTKWDPILLITQIVAMQSLLYASLGALMWLMDFLGGANHTLDHLFQYHVRSRDRITIGNVNTIVLFRKFTSPTPEVD